MVEVAYVIRKTPSTILFLYSSLLFYCGRIVLHMGISVVSLRNRNVICHIDHMCACATC